MEDYALRFAPRTFRKWSEFQVGNTAFGSTSFLVLEAIGGFLTINFGFTNAVWAIAVAGLIIFVISFPISYYAARHNIDIDLLTRSAGFGYIGSTITSLIYASYTFILFALEASIMSLAIEMYFHIPIAIAHVINAVIVIPLVAYGITTISRLQIWTQPVWLLLLVLPYWAVAYKEPEALLTLQTYFWIAGSVQDFNWLAFGSAATIAFSLVAQVGEQVDFLRFMPTLGEHNKKRWWAATILGGPGWILFGVLRQLGGALLAHLAIRHGISEAHAHEPTQMYLVAYGEIFDNPNIAIAITTLFVVISQVKINVTNAYAGSLAWSNFFSRLTHSHPGRVVWLIFNVAIALLLMEFGVFGALEKILGLLPNVSIAWIAALAADLAICKPLGLSPKTIEFKRAHLPDLNPVGTLATLCGSVISIAAYWGVFGVVAQAFSAFIALILVLILVPVFAACYGKQHYLARNNSNENCAPTQQILAGLDWIVKEKKAKKFYLIGSDYIWPRTSMKIARKHIEQHLKGEVVVEEYVALGDTQFGSVINKIKLKKPDVIYAAVVGGSNVAWFKQLNAAGLNSKKQTMLTISVTEDEVLGIGGENLEGFYSAMKYFQSLKNPNNEKFVAEFKKAYGEAAVIGDVTQAAYLGPWLWKAGVERAKSFDVDKVVEALPGYEFNEAPEGYVKVDPNHHLWSKLRIGQWHKDGQADVVYESELIAPDPFPKGYQ